MYTEYRESPSRELSDVFPRYRIRVLGADVISVEAEIL